MPQLDFNVILTDFFFLVFFFLMFYLIIYTNIVNKLFRVFILRKFYIYYFSSLLEKNQNNKKLESDKILYELKKISTIYKN